MHFDIARLLAENFELLRNSDEVSEHHRLELRLDPPSATSWPTPTRSARSSGTWRATPCKAMPEGGTLRVVGALAGDRYHFRFSDTGRGMAAEQRANLFHPFRSFFDGGTGIGMAIVYRIVQDHRGQVRVDSHPGAGTTIAVELPLRRAGAGGRRPRRRCREPGAVLIVDDEASLLDFLSLLFRGGGLRGRPPPAPPRRPAGASPEELRPRACATS